MKRIARKQSKRLTTRQRVKAEKKVREYNRKLKKEKRKNPGKFAKSKKDPGVPNICPFKDKILEEAEEARQRKIEEKQKRRERLKQSRKESKDKALEEKRSNGLDVNDKDAFKKLEELEKTLKIERELKQRMNDRSARAFFKQFGKMVDECDVIIQVLDARDPMGTRCKEVETKVLEASKRILLVLNKADLVPQDNLSAWLEQLRKEFPTVAVKSTAHSADPTKADPKSVGVSTLMSLLSSFCRNKNVESSIRVGIVGLPNVGKASLVYSIKKARGIVAVPDDAKEIELDPKIHLISKPGMILASGPTTDPDIAIRNIVNVETETDLLTPVKAILNRCPKQFLMMHYTISTFDNVEEFLRLVSERMKKLKKGGTPTQSMAAKFVLKEWTSGKIKFFTKPATDAQDAQRSEHVSDEAVTEHAKDFSFDKLDKLEKGDLEKLPIVLPSQTTVIESFGMVAVAARQEEVEQVEEESDSDEEMDSGDEENVLQQMVEATKARPKKKTDEKLPTIEKERMGKKKKVQKMNEKREKKKMVESSGTQVKKSANGKAAVSEEYDFNDF